jgi:hypothetical protein
MFEPLDIIYRGLAAVKGYNWPISLLALHLASKMESVKVIQLVHLQFSRKGLSK